MRRLANPDRKPPFGPKHQWITYKYVVCDFGLAINDLADEDLQGAFCRDVIQEMEALISVLN